MSFNMWGACTTTRSRARTRLNQAVSGGAYVRPEKVPTWPEAMSLAQGRCIQT